MTRLTQKLCVITGAGRGIGAAIAQAFAAQGAKVIVTDKNYDSAISVAKQIGGTAYLLDVSNEDHWRKLEE